VVILCAVAGAQATKPVPVLCWEIVGWGGKWYVVEVEARSFAHKRLGRVRYFQVQTLVSPDVPSDCPILMKYY